MITVIGDALLDVHVVPAVRPRPGGDVPAEIQLEPGGQGANVAVRLARQGRPVRLACAIGTDAAGGLLRERLAADGVEVVDLGSTATGAVVVLRDASGERTMLSQRVPLGPRLASAVLTDADWLVVSGYVLLEPDAALSGSGDSPRRILLGCSLERSEAAGWLDRARSLGPHLVVLNVEEALDLAGVALPAVDLGAAVPAAMVAELFPPAIVVVTHPQGAAAALVGAIVQVHAPPGDPAIDATGAGDAFAAGLIAGLVDEAWPPSPDRLERAMARAAELAGAVARVPGAQTRVDAEGQR